MAAIVEQAALRVFGNADGAYGANVNQMVDARRAGTTRTNSPRPMSRRKGFAYGVDGRPARQDAVLGARARDASTSPTRISTRSSSA